MHLLVDESLAVLILFKNKFGLCFYDGLDNCSIYIFCQRKFLKTCPLSTSPK